MARRRVGADEEAKDDERQVSEIPACDTDQSTRDYVAVEVCAGDLCTPQLPVCPPDNDSSSSDVDESEDELRQVYCTCHDPSVSSGTGPDPVERGQRWLELRFDEAAHLTADVLASAVRDATHGRLCLSQTPVLLKAVGTGQYISLPASIAVRTHVGGTVQRYRPLYSVPSTSSALRRYSHDLQSAARHTTSAMWRQTMGVVLHWGVVLLLCLLGARVLDVRDVRSDHALGEQLLGRLVKTEVPQTAAALRTLRSKVSHDLEALRNASVQLQGVAEVARLCEGQVGMHTYHASTVVSSSSGGGGGVASLQRARLLVEGVAVLNARLVNLSHRAANASGSSSFLLLADFARQHSADLQRALEQQQTARVDILVQSWWRVLAGVLAGSDAAALQLAGIHRALNTSVHSLQTHVHTYHRKAAQLTHMLSSTESVAEELEEALHEVHTLVHGSPVSSSLLMHAVAAGGVRSGLWLDRLGFSSWHDLEAVLRNARLTTDPHAPPPLAPLALLRAVAFGRLATCTLTAVLLLTARGVYACLLWTQRTLLPTSSGPARLMRSLARSAWQSGAYCALLLDALSLAGLVATVGVPVASAAADSLAQSVGVGTLVLIGSLFLGTFFGLATRAGFAFLQALWHRLAGVQQLTALAVKTWVLTVCLWGGLTVLHILTRSGWETPAARVERRHAAPAVILHQLHHALASAGSSLE